MCFTSKDQALYIAEEDIVCYKVVSRELKSVYFGMQYEYGKFNHEMLRYIRDPDYVIRVEAGLHSFNNINAAKKYLEPFYGIYRNKIVVECVIPVGSEYHKNDHEYVSNQIIISHEYKN